MLFKFLGDFFKKSLVFFLGLFCEVQQGYFYCANFFENLKFRITWYEQKQIFSMKFYLH